MGATLVTGIAGGLAQEVAERLHASGADVIGVDYRPVERVPARLAAIPRYRASYDKTAIEDVFRRHRISTVLHLGRVGDLSEAKGKRFLLNVVGTQKIMRLCVAHGVESLVVLSTFHIYGAHPHDHIPISEEDPLRAGIDFPEIADAIQLDNMASTWVYRHPEVRTVVLRPCNVVGPRLRNTMSRVLRLSRVPYLVGFDPMVQLVHQDDLARAVLAARRGDRRGVFNVAGGSAAPWRAVIDLTGARGLPLPSSLAAVYARARGDVPQYLLNFLKFPAIITDAAFRAAFGWAPEVGLAATVESTVRPPAAR